MFALRHLVAIATFALPFASAFISGVRPYKGTYHASDTSKFRVTFTWGYAKVSYEDLTVNFGLTTPAGITASNNSTMGRPLYNLDLIALNKTSIYEDTTFSIPLPASAFDDGSGNATSGKYVLVAVVDSANGLWPNLIPFQFKLQLPFTAVLPKH
ncbi:hypothetical protein BKA62DRAFT_696039 [Auriculariales sp. MPI-PUGE-AT-0066]|nr:hypothetical protein BKA62DRAFT_696039 [Auriculariales sp. MPI-PUGE-AT-0066]